MCVCVCVCVSACACVYEGYICNMLMDTYICACRAGNMRICIANAYQFQVKRESLPPNDSQCVRISQSCCANRLS